MVTIKELRRITIRNKKEDLYLSFLRKLSIYPLKVFVTLNLKPDQITFSWMFLHLISVILFIFGKYEYIIAAILVKFLADLIDTTDGAIARYHGKGNFKGVYLEGVGHHLIMPYMFFAIGLGVFYNTNNIIHLFASVILALNFCILELAFLNKDNIILKKIKNSQEISSEEIPRSIMHKIYRILIEIYIALHSFILFFFAIFNKLDIFLIFAALYSVIIVLMRISYDYINNLGLKNKHYEFQK